MDSLDSGKDSRDSRTVGGSPAKDSKPKSKRSEFASANTVGVAESVSASSKNSSSCYLCQGKHSLHACDQFKKMNPQERFSFAKKANLCLNCLHKGHVVTNCNC